MKSPTLPQTRNDLSPLIWMAVAACLISWFALGIGIWLDRVALFGDANQAAQQFWLDNLLRFYWFRLTDALLPLVAVIVGADLLWQHALAATLELRGARRNLHLLVLRRDRCFGPRPCLGFE